MKKKTIFINSLMIFICTAISCYASASASVKMRGTIIETACAIDVGSRDQTVDMGSLPISSIRRDGQGPARIFNIRLVNCVFERQNPTKPNWQYFRVTFDGSEQHGLFKIDGQVKGVGLQIQNEYGEIAIPGKGFSRQFLSEGEQNLSFQLRLVSNKDTLVAGKYSSQLRFKLDYE